MKTATKNFIYDEDGVTIIEYAVAGGMIAAAVVAAFKGLGVTANGIVVGINTAINS